MKKNKKLNNNILSKNKLIKKEKISIKIKNNKIIKKINNKIINNNKNN